jgi:hypothetical protein
LRKFRTYSSAMAFCLSVEAHGWNHVKSDLQTQISFFTELIFDDFEAFYAPQKWSDLDSLRLFSVIEKVSHIFECYGFLLECRGPWMGPCEK